MLAAICEILRRSRLLMTAMDDEDYSAQYLAAIQTPVCLGGFCERVTRGDGHPNPAVADMTIQPREFSWTRKRVEGPHAKCAPRFRLWLDAVRVDDASSLTYEIEAALEPVAAGEGQHAIQSIGSECAESIDRFLLPCVDDSMRTKASDEPCRGGA